MLASSSSRYPPTPAPLLLLLCCCCCCFCCCGDSDARFLGDDLRRGEARVGDLAAASRGLRCVRAPAVAAACGEITTRRGDGVGDLERRGLFLSSGNGCLGDVGSLEASRTQAQTGVMGRLEKCNTLRERVCVCVCTALSTSSLHLHHLHVPPPSTVTPLTLSDECSSSSPLGSQ